MVPSCRIEEINDSSTSLPVPPVMDPAPASDDFIKSFRAYLDTVTNSRTGKSLSTSNKRAILLSVHRLQRPEGIHYPAKVANDTNKVEIHSGVLEIPEHLRPISLESNFSGLLHAVISFEECHHDPSHGWRARHAITSCVIRSGLTEYGSQITPRHLVWAPCNFHLVE